MITLLSVNIGCAAPINSKSGFSAIDKRPQPGPVFVGPLGLAGDECVDTKHHGGAEQAVYIYFANDYDWWMEELGQPLDSGTFGENLTLSGLASADIHIGDRFAIGGVMLEVTSPRIPCETLAARMGDKMFVKRFMHARRPGCYCRVLAGGEIAAGQNVVHHPIKGHRMHLLELFDGSEPDREEMEKRLTLPLHAKTRADYQERLGQGLD